MLARPPTTFAQWRSTHMILSPGSSRRDGPRTGRNPASSARSAVRADWLLERTEENVAAASTRVPPAVASEEIVAQSVIAAAYGMVPDVPLIERGEKDPGGG